MEDIRVKPGLEVHVRARVVMEDTPAKTRKGLGEVPVEVGPVPGLKEPSGQVIGRFRVQCGPLEDGKAVCRLTREEE